MGYTVDLGNAHADTEEVWPKNREIYKGQNQNKGHNISLFHSLSVLRKQAPAVDTNRCKTLLFPKQNLRRDEQTLILTAVITDGGLINTMIRVCTATLGAG